MRWNWRLAWTSPVIVVATFIFNFRSVDLTPTVSKSVLVLLIDSRHLFAVNYCLQEMLLPRPQQSSSDCACLEWLALSHLGWR